MRYQHCRSTLRYLLATISGRLPQEIIFRDGLNGKPTIDQKDLFFNVSHTEDVFVIAVTAIGPVGVDIEKKNRDLAPEKLKELIFSDWEKELFDSLPSSQQREAMLAAWIRKESFFKALGSGLTSPLKELEVSFIPGSEAYILQTGWQKEEKRFWKMFDLEVDDHYLGALSVRSGNIEPRIIHCDSRDLNAINQINEVLNEIHYHGI